MNTFLIILTLIFSFSLQAAECLNIRLDERNGPLSRIPIYDQDSFGSCYAYAAAQLIDAYRFSHNLPSQDHLTSPIKISTDYANLGYYDQIQNGGGNEAAAINEAKRYGSCNKKVTDKLLAKRSENNFYKIAIEKYRKYLDEKKQEKTNFIKLKEIFIPNKSLALQEIQCDLKNNGLPSDLIPNLQDLENIIERSVGYDEIYLRELLTNICKKSTIDLSQLPQPKLTNFTKQSLDPLERSIKAQDTINKLLTLKNPQPISVLDFVG